MILIDKKIWEKKRQHNVLTIYTHPTLIAIENGHLIIFIYPETFGTGIENEISKTSKVYDNA